MYGTWSLPHALSLSLAYLACNAVMVITNDTLICCCVRQISSLAPDAVECCSLARKLGLLLTDYLPDDAIAMVDEADDFGAQATASIAGGAGKDDVCRGSLALLAASKADQVAPLHYYRRTSQIFKRWTRPSA